MPCFRHFSAKSKTLYAYSEYLMSKIEYRIIKNCKMKNWWSTDKTYKNFALIMLPELQRESPMYFFLHVNALFSRTIKYIFFNYIDESIATLSNWGWIDFRHNMNQYVIIFICSLKNFTSVFIEETSSFRLYSAYIYFRYLSHFQHFLEKLNLFSRPHYP